MGKIPFEVESSLWILWRAKYQYIVVSELLRFLRATLRTQCHKDYILQFNLGSNILWYKDAEIIRCKWLMCWEERDFITSAKCLFFKRKCDVHTEGYGSGIKRRFSRSPTREKRYLENEKMRNTMVRAGLPNTFYGTLLLEHAEVARGRKTAKYCE